MLAFKNVVVTAMAQSKTVAPFESKTWYFSENENLAPKWKPAKRILYVPSASRAILQ